PRDGLLQQVVELHPVRNLRQSIVTGQIADAALGPLAVRNVARDEDIALELRVIARDVGTRQGHWNGLARARADDGLARLLRSLQKVESLPLALFQDGG